VKKFFYFLTAVGPDQPGLVAHMSGILVSYGCNLEDSSMMRLGSEFGMFAIFTSVALLPLEKIKRKRVFKNFFFHIKLISAKHASFKKTKRDLWMLRVHGTDRTGLVHNFAQCLYEYRFNITDLSTHRTIGRVPGYILFIEGEPATSSTKNLKIALHKLAMKLTTHVSFTPVTAASF